jgi:hypothetical protein
VGSAMKLDVVDARDAPEREGVAVVEFEAPRCSAANSTRIEVRAAAPIPFPDTTTQRCREVAGVGSAAFFVLEFFVLEFFVLEFCCAACRCGVESLLAGRGDGRLCAGRRFGARRGFETRRGACPA